MENNCARYPGMHSSEIKWDEEWFFFFNEQKQQTSERTNEQEGQMNKSNQKLI